MNHRMTKNNRISSMTYHQNPWRQSQMVKRDFLLILVYVLGNMYLPFILADAINWLSFTLLHRPSGLTYTSQLYALLAQLSVVLIFWALHYRALLNTAIARVKQLQRYIYLMIIVLLVMYVANIVYANVMQFLPEHWQFHDTQNEQEIRKLFSNIKVWPLLFLNIVIITPIVEELLFRHLLIHELGKKLSYPVMSIISILLFAGIHVTDATSPFEIGPYLIMATSFVVAYNMSGRNLAVTIALHSFNNLLSFILTLLQFL